MSASLVSCLRRSYFACLIFLLTTMRLLLILLVSCAPFLSAAQDTFALPTRPRLRW